MDRQAFIDFLLQQGFQNCGMQLCGVIGEFPVMVVTPTNRKVKNCTVSFLLETAPDSDVKKPVCMDLKAVAGSAAIRGNTAMLTFRESAQSPLAEQLNRLEDVAEILVRNSILPPENCAICQEPGADAWAYYNMRYQPVHQTCIQDKHAVAAEKAALNEGSYLLGLLGALLGALVGCIPNVLSIWFMETIYAILYSLIPLCAYFGYKLLRGKMNWAATVITILVSFVSVYAIEILVNTIWLMTDYNAGFGEALMVMFMLLGEPGVFGDLTADAIPSFGFIILGIIFVWRQITRTGKSAAREIKSLFSTITLKPGVEPLLQEEQMELDSPYPDITGDIEA